MVETANIVICHPLRTPIGRFLGSLASLSASDLATAVLAALHDRAHLQPGDVDEVILGNCNPNGEAPATGRAAALDAGPGIEVPNGRPSSMRRSSHTPSTVASMRCGALTPWWSHPAREALGPNWLD